MGQGHLPTCLVDKVYQDAEEWQESIVVQLVVRAVEALNI